MHSNRWLKSVPSPLTRSLPADVLPGSSAASSSSLDQTLTKLHLQDSDGDEDDRAVISATDSAFGVEEIGRIDFITFLPAELAVKILSYVDRIEELKVLSLVSQTWHQLAQDNAVWKAHFFSRWSPPKALLKAPYSPRNWRALYESRLALNAQWKSSSPVKPTTCCSINFLLIVCDR